MPSLFTVMLSLGLLVAVNAQVIPVLVLDCELYPDVCDNTCHAVHCRGFDDPNAFLHYDRYSGSDQPNPRTVQTSADLRRQAIGCGGTNYCPRGTECDEFPYASTYDGGLGCIENNYRGRDRLAQSGVTRCSDPTQNGDHGRDLLSFYRRRRLADGDRFQVSFDARDIRHAPLCRDLITYGDNMCPDSSTSWRYRFRSTPAADSYCPPRGRYRRSYPPGADALREYEEREPVEDETPRRRNGTVTLHTVKLSDGSEMTTMHGPRPVVGTMVTRRGPDGTHIEVTVID